MDAEFFMHLVAISVSFGVGLPVIARGLAARDLPVALLGASLVFEGFEWLSWMIAAFTPVSEMPAVDGFAIACRISISVAAVCMLGFTLIAFCRDSFIARGVALALVAGLCVGFFGSGMVGDWGGWRSDHPWVWVELVA